MAMGIVVTSFTLFGMLALVILDAALEEPTENTQAKPKARPRAARTAAYPHLRKKAA